ncbi:MAG: GntR family transcriptional regulator [Burkholderiaceae bacterium]
MIANPTPRYYRIYRLLKQAIESHQFTGDEALPSENALAQQYQVSRLTIRRSLELLQHDGLIERRQGRGTFPKLGNIKTAPLPADINKLLAGLSEMGSSTRASVLSFGYETASPYVCTQLELPQGAKVQKSIRVRYRDEQPFSYLTTYVPEHIGRQYGADDLVRQPIQAIFKTLGMKLASAEQGISAILADVQHAEALRVDAGAALLRIRRVVRDLDGAPVEYLDAAYNPAHFEYRMTLANKRSKAGDNWVMDAKKGAAK